MAEVIIRLASPTDAERVAELSRQLGYQASPEDVRSRIERISNDEFASAFVAVKDGIVAGWIQVSTRVTIESGEMAEIVGLVVDESERGNGIGRRLVREAEDWAKRLSRTSLRVRTDIVRIESDSFYRKLGYTEVKKQTVFRKSLG